MNENTVESQVMLFEEVKDELIYYGTQEPLHATFEIDMSPYQVGDFFTMINIGA